MAAAAGRFGEGSARFGAGLEEQPARSNPADRGQGEQGAQPPEPSVGAAQGLLGGGLVGFEARESLAELGEGDLPLPVPNFMHRALAARQSLVGAGMLGGDLVFESLDAFEG